MEFAQVFWQFDCEGQTKIIIGVIFCALFLGCLILNKKRNDKKKEEAYRQFGYPTHNIMNGLNNSINPNVPQKVNKPNNLNRLLNDKYYLQYKQRNNPTKCEQKYIQCMESNHINNFSDYFCYPCDKDGSFKDKVYNPLTKKWITQDRKTGTFKGASLYP